MSDFAITISLSRDEALVLSEFLDRWQRTEELVFEHQAEYLSLTSVAAQLDRSLVEPFGRDYAALVGEARARILTNRVDPEFSDDFPGPRRA